MYVPLGRSIKPLVLGGDHTSKDTIGLAVVFFPALAGVAITSILWGVVHLTLGFVIAAVWRRMPIVGDPLTAS